MSECLDTDAILTIGHALDWKVDEGLSHLRTCTNCRAQLETLQRTREGLLASTPVDSETLQQISAALHEASRGEFDHARRPRLPQAAEACAAGVTALLTLVSNGVPIEGPATAAVGFSLGAILMVAGTALARRLPTFEEDGANV
jgi:hypothetical protein